MKSVRQKWASHKTYRRIQKTWQEYNGVDKRQVVQKLAWKNEGHGTETRKYQDWCFHVSETGYRKCVRGERGDSGQPPVSP